MASVKIKHNTKAVDAKIKIQSSVFLRNMTDEVIRVAKPHTPKDTGRMRQDVIKQVLGLKGKVIWGKNYAGIQALKQFTNYTTPGTGPEFDVKGAKGAVLNTVKVARKSGLEGR